MMLEVFCVKDSATQAFGTPMFFIAKGQAIRSFSDEVNRADKDNQLYNHSSDFELYFLGTFDTDTARFATADAVCIVRGVDVRLK